MNPSLLIAVARRAIEQKFNHEMVDYVGLVRDYPELSVPGAAFVTLTLYGKLRGCIGSIVAHRPLLEDLISNAQAAAYKDPRFPPLSIDEVKEICIEVSLLSAPEMIEYRDREELLSIIRPGIDGVILQHGNHQATFLPQVWDEIPDFNNFFGHLGVKAGIGSDPLSLHPTIYTYQVEKYKEKVNG